LPHRESAPILATSSRVRESSERNAAPRAGTPLAKTASVRTLLCLVALGGVARADSLWEADIRAGYGVAMSGSQGTMSARRSPLTLEATGAIAVNEEPNVAGFAGMVVETLDRSAVGTVVGARLTQGPLRLAGGGTWIFAPYTLWGAVASAGTCKRMSHS